MHFAMLDLLRSDSRTSIAAVARDLGISRANAYARLAALEEAGVILGYTVRVDPGALGKRVAALVFVSLWQNQWRDFRTRLGQLPELEYFAVTTGQFDAMLLVRSRDVPGVHALVVGELSQWPSIKATETVFLMDERRYDWSLRDVDRGSVLDGGDHGATRFVSAPTARDDLRR